MATEDGYARIQRLMRDYVRLASRGAQVYVANSAVPIGKGEWSLWVRPSGGGRPGEVRVMHRDLVKQVVNPRPRRRNPSSSKWDDYDTQPFEDFW
jgi:hypothetical protein